MANNSLGVHLLSLKLLIFMVDNNVLWSAQNAPNRTIFIICFSGEHATGPPSTNLSLHPYKATYALSLVN